MSASLTFQVSRTAADYDAFRRQANREVTRRPLHRFILRAVEAHQRQSNP